MGGNKVSSNQFPANKIIINPDINNIVQKAMYFSVSFPKQENCFSNSFANSFMIK